MNAVGVVLGNLLHGELLTAAGPVVAAGITQAACDSLEGHVARLQQWAPAARALVAARELKARPAGTADVVAALAQCDGRVHVLLAQRTREHVEHALPQGLAAAWRRHALRLTHGGTHAAQSGASF